MRHLSTMKSFSMLALILIGAAASAQTDAWFAARFGLNAPAPDLFGYQGPNDYKNFAYNEGKPAARFNNSTGIMTGAGIMPSTVGHAWSDPNYHGWADIFEITDLLPKNTWIRVAANLQNHFPDPYNPNGQANKDRNIGAVINRIMFRGTGLTTGLNVLWNVTPGVFPYTAPTDSWSTITTNPTGQKLSANVTTGDPAKRDWWRPYDAYLPYLKNNVQTFVYDVNDAAAQITRQRTTGTMTENFIGRMGFQMGNEPAAGHPGGSVDGQVGSWDGTGRILEGTMAGLSYKPRAAAISTYQVPASFGTNPLSMPAFSMFGESVDAYRLNYTKGQLRNIQWGGSMAPGLNEIASYPKEMTGKSWPTLCGKRSLHFNSPVYRWRFNSAAEYMSKNPSDLLASSLIDSTKGRFETPEEYAIRWVNELEKQVDLVANLPMPGTSKVVDVTECYFTCAESGGSPFNPGMKFANGSSPDWANLTFDQVRQLSRSYCDRGGAMTPLAQAMPTREALLIAIRNELFARDTSKVLTANLGRIYWWGACWPDPRIETGLCNGDHNEVIGYTSWGDFRLTLSEVKALWNK